ncbi:MAG: DNA polymerase/3'-5' exonuclease PolX [Candidatus Kaelpia imicola]|nr:DNA polymerase/3'-5' exonuclease PolX [Candidatus Kaelpia imicola]
MKNREIADIFNKIADILEIKDANLFRIRAYRRAAASLESLPHDLDKLVEEDRLTEITGVGKDLSEKIKEYYRDGEIGYLSDLLDEVPKELLLMLKIPGLGPKKVKLFYQKLDITSIAQLERAAKEGKLRELPSIKGKTEENIIKGIEFIRRGNERMLLGLALPLAESIISELKKLKEVKRVSIAGSLRRMRDTIGDIDILIGSNKPAKIMDRFSELDIVKRVILKGETKTSILTEGDTQVDLRVVGEDSFGAALQYFSGSKSHNIHLRQIAQRKGLKINEYGVFKVKDDKKIASKDEEDIYKTLGMSFIPPELREDRGEIERALEGRLPELIERKDIKGDLHIHSDFSDGRVSLEEVIETGYRKGYKYIAVTDHSKSLGVAHGLSEERLLEQIQKIREIEKRYKNFKVLTGTEMDIKADGSLDWNRDILEKLDIVIAAVHAGFRQSKEKMTERILSAIESGWVDIIAHPSGRLLGEREPYEVDWDIIFKAAAKHKVALEINSHILRLDLTDINVFRAKEQGVLISINTDAHSKEHFDMIKYGVSVGKRGWLSKRDVINCLSYSKLKKFLEQRKKI